VGAVVALAPGVADGAAAGVAVGEPQALMTMRPTTASVLR
jgi:hypothetical protein